MVNQKFLIFDYDDTIMPSTITKKLASDPDYGASQVKEKLQVFFRFIVYWKKTTGIPVIILSAGTIAYIHLISLFGRFLRVSINFYDPGMDVCIFIPIPFYYMMSSKRNMITLENNNAVNLTLQENCGRYYKRLFESHSTLEYYSISPSQLEHAMSKAYTVVPEKSQREFINGISHKKISYQQKVVDQQTVTGCFYLPGYNYQKQVSLYEFMNCRRQFKNLDALRRHIAFVTNKHAKAIHFYFFDDKASHLGMGDDDIYLSKPFKYPSTFFVGKIIPILESLMESESEVCSREAPKECHRRNELKLLNKLVHRLSKTNNLVFVSKKDGASPIHRRKREKKD
jgi:hypothetical protein